MKERDLNRKAREFVKKTWAGGLWSRIENTAAHGTPDTFIAAPGIGCGWIEMKVAGPQAKPDYRTGQQAALMELDNAGVAAHTLIASDNGRIRLLGPRCLGHDWREHLVDDCQWDDKAALKMIFLRCMGAEIEVENV